MSGGIFYCHNWGNVKGIWFAHSRRAPETSYKEHTVPTTKNCSVQMVRVPRQRNFVLNWEQGSGRNGVGGGEGTKLN